MKLCGSFLHRVPIDVGHLFVVLLDGTQRPIEKSPLQKDPTFAATRVDQPLGVDLWRFAAKKRERDCIFEEEHIRHHAGDTWVFLVKDAESNLVGSFVAGPDRGLSATQH